MKCFVSCVTYEPKLRPTMQCHVGLYFLSNSFLMKAAMSFSMLYFSKAWKDYQSMLLVTASWLLVLSRYWARNRISLCTTERDAGLWRGKNQVLNFKEQKKVCFWPQDRWKCGWIALRVLHEQGVKRRGIRSAMIRMRPIKICAVRCEGAKSSYERYCESIARLAREEDQHCQKYVWASALALTWVAQSTASCCIS